MSHSSTLAPYQAALALLREQGLARDPLRPAPDLRRGPLDFTSNDYLSLASHPLLAAAARQATSAHGTSQASSYVVTGRSPLANDLEHALCDHFRSPAAVLFPSGYQANLGALSALALPGTQIFSDAHNHASIIDGCRLSKARTTVFPHLDLTALEAALRSAPPAPSRIIVTDALFSMTGTLAPLPELARLASRYNALLVVDEAHSVGVLGPTGGGLTEQTHTRPDLLIGTFSKALGSHGAFALASPTLIAWLHSKARPLIYSTALPPASLAAARAALSILPGQLATSRRARLQQLATRLRASLRNHGHPCTGDGTPIVSLEFPDPLQATRIHQALLNKGLLVWAYRPPTVPSGTSLLRISLQAAHQPEHLAHLQSALLAALAPRPKTSSPHPLPSIPPTPPPLHPTHTPSRPALHHAFAVLGTDTGVGKTTVGAGILTLLRTRGLTVHAAKPIETGLLPSRASTVHGDLPDHLLLDTAAHQAAGSALYDSYTLPAAPAAAARHAGRPVDPDALTQHLLSAHATADLLLIEGAGGLMVPFTDDLLWLDLLRRWRVPVLLVTRLGLGTLNHTLLTTRTLAQADIPLLAVLPNTLRPEGPESSLTPDLLQARIHAPLLDPLPHTHTTPEQVAAHIARTPLVEQLLALSRPHTRAP